MAPSRVGEDAGDLGSHIIGGEATDIQTGAPAHHVLDSHGPFLVNGVVDLRPDIWTAGVYLLEGVGEVGGIVEELLGLSAVELHQVSRGRVVEAMVQSARVG